MTYNRVVSVLKFHDNRQRVRQAIEMCGGLKHLRTSDRILIKPNLVMWDSVYPFPKYGVITTSLLVEEMVKLLSDYGCSDITLGEATIKDQDLGSSTKAAFAGLGYDHLQKRYGLKLVDFDDEPFVETDFGEFSLNIARQVFETDFLINLPVLKTHSQTKVSLGLKNLKGCLDLKSKIRCHNREIPLEHFIARLGDKIAPGLTVIDGIYSLERGPIFNGKAYRSDLLIASRDTYAADWVGCKVLGLEPSEVPYLADFAAARELPLDGSTIQVVGEALDHVSSNLAWDWEWNKENSAPEVFDRLGIRGIYYPKYDQTLCSGCSHMNNLMLILLLGAYREKPFSGVEYLGGKSALSRGGYEKTFLFGKCAVRLNNNNPAIQEAVKIKGCPPRAAEIVRVLNEQGLPASLDMYAAYREAHAARYKEKPEFDEAHFAIQE